MLAVSIMAIPFISCTKTVPEKSDGSSDVDEVDVDDADDIYSDASFDRTISVVFASGGASVSGESSDQEVTVSGNDVTITNNGTEKIRYELSGSTSDGFFKLYSETQQALVLNGVSITNPAGAAINNQSGKRTFVVLDGSNSLADGTNYSDESDTEDMKAAFFSEGQLLFSGSGSLTVTAKGKAGITSDDYIKVFSGPTLKVSSTAGHGLRGKDAVVILGGTVSSTVSATGKKAISTDGAAYFSGGSTTLTVTGNAGTVDDELTGTAGVKADGSFTMADGSLVINNSGQGGKGISCDGDGTISGGSITIKTTGSNYGSSSGGMMTMAFPGGGSFPGGGTMPGSETDNSNSCSAKGMKFDGNLTISGGTVNVHCSAHEGIEAKGTMDITGGNVYSYASDDAINSGSHMNLSGGYVCGYSTGNDGIDANGNLVVKGGVVYAVGTSGAEVGLDANTEGGYKLYIQGGTLIAIGGLESGASLSQAVVTSSSWSKNTNYALYDSSGNLLMAFKTPSSGGTSLVMSSSSVKNGSSYTLYSGVTISGGTSWFEGLYTEGGSVDTGTIKGSTLTGSTSSTGGGMPF